MHPAGGLPTSVQLWLRDIRWTPDGEHVTLQAKSIPGGPAIGRSPTMIVGKPNDPAFSTRIRVPGSQDREAVRQYEYVTAHMEEPIRSVSSTLKKYDKLRSPEAQADVENIDRTAGNCRALNADLSGQVMVMGAAFDNLFRPPYNYCQLLSVATSIATANEVLAIMRHDAASLASLSKVIKDGRKNDIGGQNEKSLITSLSHCHGQFVEQIVLMDCQILVRALDRSSDTRSFTKNVNEINNFANRGNNVRRLLCQAGAVTSLLRSNLPFDMTESTRVVSLRCLANISCHTDALVILEKDGNFHKLIALLWINENSDAVRCETAGVLAQIAANLQPSKPKSDVTAAAAVALLDGLIDTLPAIIRALTHVTKHVQDEETLLVVSACMANLSFLHSVTPVLELLCQQDCISSLLMAWRRGFAESLFTRNQVIGTVLSLSLPRFGQEYLLRQSSLAEFLIDVLVQCLPETKRDTAEYSVLNRVTRRILLVVGTLLKLEQFRKTFLKAQGIIVYQKVLAKANQSLQADAERYRVKALIVTVPAQ